MMTSPRKPLQTDCLATTDGLNRQSIAHEISANILHHIETSNQSIVLGIHGPWGSGKSNLLYYFKEHIKTHAFFTNGTEPEQVEETGIFKRKSSVVREKRKKLYILEFNPWRFSGKEQLHKAFLNEFALKIGSKNQQLREKMERLLNKLGWLESVTDYGAVVKKGMESYFDISVEQLKEETNRLMETEDTHAVVIIDDVDRLMPAEMLEIFQLIKLNANFSNTVFIISFDKKIVAQAITKAIKVNGDEYLEKIIQVDYSLPTIPDETMEDLFFVMLKDLVVDESKFQTSSLDAAWLMHGLSTYFTNLRDLKRFFNSLSFRLPSIQDHVDLHDFILIEAIRIFDFAAYVLIRDNYKESQQFSNRSYYGDRLSGLKSGPTLDLYSYLFSVTRKRPVAAQGSFPIRQIEFFDRYFTFSVSKLDARADEFRKFQLNPDGRQPLLGSLIQSGKVDFLLRRIIGTGVEHSWDYPEEAITPLIDVWNNYSVQFADHWRSVWNAIKVVLVSQTDQNAAYVKLFGVLSTSVPDFSPARFTFLWTLVENINREDEKNIDQDLDKIQLLLQANKKSLEKNFIYLLDRYQREFMFSSTHPLLYRRIFFCSFPRLSPQKYAEQFRALFNDENSFLDFLRLVVHVDPETKKLDGIDQRFLDMTILQELNIDFRNKLNSLNPDGLSDEDGKLVMYVRENVIKP